MVKENSGKIYIIPLNFDLGFALCKLVDYSDIAPFDGALVSVLAKQFKITQEIPSISDIDKIGILFGPLPLNKFPNTKGKGAWKYVAQTFQFDKGLPVFKETVERVALYKALDWSTVNKWYKVDFSDKEVFSDYESIRGLEMRTLFDMRSVEIRATMHFLLLSRKKVEDYYDLTVERNRNLYLQMVNTSFAKDRVGKYLEVISQRV